MSIVNEINAVFAPMMITCRHIGWKVTVSHSGHFTVTKSMNGLDWNMGQGQGVEEAKLVLKKIKPLLGNENGIAIMATQYHVQNKKEFYTYWYEDGAEVPYDAIQLGSPEQLIINVDGSVTRPNYCIKSVNPGRVIMA